MKMEENMMNNLLNEIKENKEMIALYTNNHNLDKFHVAYIIHIEDGKILECNVGIHGEFDGYAAEYVEDIYRIETNTGYLNKIEYLAKTNFSQDDIEDINLEPFAFLINLSIINNFISTIYLKDSENLIIGYVTKMEEGKVFVDIISDIGKYDGVTVFYFDDIVKIMVNDVEARELDSFYKKNKNGWRKGETLKQSNF